MVVVEFLSSFVLFTFPFLAALVYSSRLSISSLPGWALQRETVESVSDKPSFHKVISTEKEVTLDHMMDIRKAMDAAKADVRVCCVPSLCIPLLSFFLNSS